MTKRINALKKKLLEYRDFYDGDIPMTDKINAAKTETDIYNIIQEYRKLLENQAIDAEKHLHDFEKSLNLITP